MRMLQTAEKANLKSQNHNQYVYLIENTDWKSQIFLCVSKTRLLKYIETC